MEYKSKTQLPTHKLNHVCSHCEKVFGTKLAWQQHESTHNCNGGEKRLSCSFCDKTYNSHEGLNRHVRLHTGEKPFVCTDAECGRHFFSRTELIVHTTQCHLDPTAITPVHACDVCRRKFKTTAGLSRHKANKHGKKQPPAHSCDECGRTFKFRAYLRDHQKIHSTANWVKCLFCPKSFKTPRYLYSHLKRKHTCEKPYACSVVGCGARFCTGSELTSHNKQVHLRERPHECSHCGKPFSMKSSLVQHERTHTDERPYSCDTCDKTFAQSSNLTRHLRSHLGEKPYDCSICGKRFKTKSKAKYHSETAHDPIAAEAAKRQCKICHKYFTPGNLRAHEKTHTRDMTQRPFTCEMCPKSYYTKQGLYFHLPLHGPKTHICTFCNKAFHLKAVLAAHTRYHLREKKLPRTLSLIT